MAKGHKKTTTVSADKATTAMQGRVYDASQQAAKNYQALGADPNMTAAMNLFGQYGQQGQTGAAALAGDQGAVGQMMNPYMQQVMDAYNAQFGQNSGVLRKNANSAATASGAFGGDRASLEMGSLQGELGRGHMEQTANLLRGGYNDAMGRAGSLANLGLTAGNAQMQGGEYLRNVAMEQANPDIMRQQLLAQGMQTGNAGNKTTEDYSKTSALQNILGAATTGVGLFGTGGLSGLAGLFGKGAAGGIGSLMGKFGGNFGGGLFGGAQGLGQFGGAMVNRLPTNGLGQFGQFGQMMPSRIPTPGLGQFGR